eukprot:1149664-Prymnesium_polylepis.2
MGLLSGSGANYVVCVCPWPFPNGTPLSPLVCVRPPRRDLVPPPNGTGPGIAAPRRVAVTAHTGDKLRVVVTRQLGPVGSEIVPLPLYEHPGSTCRNPWRENTFPAA